MNTTKISKNSTNTLSDRHRKIIECFFFLLWDRSPKLSNFTTQCCSAVKRFFHSNPKHTRLYITDCSHWWPLWRGSPISRPEPPGSLEVSPDTQKDWWTQHKSTPHTMHNNGWTSLNYPICTLTRLIALWLLLGLFLCWLLQQNFVFKCSLVSDVF